MKSDLIDIDVDELIEDAGFDAGYNDPETECPYVIDTQDATIWIRGFNEGVELSNTPATANNVVQYI